MSRHPDTLMAARSGYGGHNSVGSGQGVPFTDWIGASWRGRAVGRMGVGWLPPSGRKWQGAQSCQGATELASQGQRWGRCKVRRRAERVSRPAREKKRRLRVLVVTTGSPRPMRVVQRASNCVGCQERWAISAGHEPRHVELFLTMAFRMVSSLRMQATKATFFALPAASSLW